MEKNGVVDIDKTTETMEPEKSTGGGLYVPGKDRVVYVPQERKSRLGLDALAIAKREGSQNDGVYKVPKARTISIAASAEDEDKSESTVIEDESGLGGTASKDRRANTRYRKSTNESSQAESSVTEDHDADSHGTRSKEHRGSDVPASPSGYERENYRNERRHHRDESRSGSRRVQHVDNFESKEPYFERDSRSRYGHEYNRNREHYSERDSRSRYDHERGRSKEPYSERDSRSRYDHEYGRKRSRYEGSRRTPGRSDWDDGQWEWEDTPRRDSVSSSRHHQPSPSPMFLGASPDTRLVSPWSGGNTPYSSSPWDHVSPSPVPIRASGSSVKSSTSRHSGRSHQLTFSSGTSTSYEDEVTDKSEFGEEHKYEITESMRAEMEYDADRAWYDREEGSTMFDGGDNSSLFLGDEATFQKKKRLSLPKD